jgi:hypothetical protein
LLATPVAPTAVLLLPVGSWLARFLPVSRRVPHLAEPWTPSSSGQPWLFHLNNSWFVTSPSPRYASRPNRAIDDKGLSPHKIHSLVGCPPTVWASPAAQAVAPAGAPSTGCSAELPALGRVQPFPAQEGADLARLRTVIGLVQDTQVSSQYFGGQLAAN